MKRNDFGRKQLTPLGLGLAALGRPGYINLGHADDLNETYAISAIEAHAHAVLDAAWEAGIRYIDAARSYGKAEAFLSSWLAARGISADEIAVGSKWGYTYTADWQVTLPKGEKHEVKEHSLPVLNRQIQESRDLLGTHLDLYQIHSATLESGVLDNTKVLNRLSRLRAERLAIGLSVSGEHQAETIWQALEVEIDGQPLFSSVQATWNLLERSATAALQAAHDVGWVVIIKEALANGRLTGRGISTDTDHPLQRQASKHNTTIDALALAAVIRQPFVDVTLSGAATVDQLHSNVAALQVAWNDDLTVALTGLAEPAEQYWKTRSQLRWN